MTSFPSGFWSLDFIEYVPQQYSWNVSPVAYYRECRKMVRTYANVDMNSSYLGWWTYSSYGNFLQFSWRCDALFISSDTPGTYLNNRLTTWVSRRQVWCSTFLWGSQPCARWKTGSPMRQAGTPLFLVSCVLNVIEALLVLVFISHTLYSCVTLSGLYPLRWHWAKQLCTGHGTIVAAIVACELFPIGA